MLADYRCNEIKSNVINLNEGKIREILNLATLKDIETFKDNIIEITDGIISQYESLANNYLEERCNYYKLQLKNYLSERFLIAFINQTKRLIPVSQKKFRESLDKKLKNGK
jgi:hypothetical protein